MGKLKSIYVCSSCGYESPKWYGKCPECGDWNTFTEEVRTEELPSKQKTAGLVEEPAADSVMSISDVLVEDE